MIKKINLIVAYDNDLLIGVNNSLYYNLPNDLKRFKTITTTVLDNSKQNAIVMGKNTWISLPIKPLPNRLNCILSSSLQENSHNCKTFSSFSSCIHDLNNNINIESIFIIGGSSVYKHALNFINIDTIYLTRIYNSVPKNVIGTRHYFPINLDTKRLDEKSNYDFFELKR